MRVREAMSRRIQAVGQWEEIEVPGDLIRFRRFEHLPVLDEQGRLVGLLARADLLTQASRTAGDRRFRVAEAMASAPVFVRDEDELPKAAEHMAAKKFSMLPVVDAEDRLVGLLSDTEVFEALSGKKPPVRELEEIPVTQVMTPNPVTIGPDENLDEAARAMLEGGFRHLPVVDADNRLLGMLSEGDLRQQLGTNPRGLWHAPPEATDSIVSNIMRPDPVSVRVDSTLTEALDLLADERVTALPVLGEDDRVVGMLSYVDLIVWIREHAAPLTQPQPSP